MDKKQENLPKITVFTDGSKMGTEETQKVGAGAIIYYPDNTKTLTKPLAPENTINQAELMAIEMVADEINDNLNKEDRHEITIYTDSQTTIHKLFNKWSTSKQLTNTVTKLQCLQAQARHNLRIEKVKAHANIEVNEIADTLAKEATKDSRQTQNEVGLNKAIIKARLQSWLKEKNTEQLIK